MNREMRRQLEKRQRQKGDYKTQFKVAAGLRDEDKQEWFYRGFVRGTAEALKFIKEELPHIEGIGPKTIDRIYNGLHRRMLEQKEGQAI